MTPAEVSALNSAEARWPLTVYAVEASDEEYHQLWYREERETGEWVQCHGWLVTLAEVSIARLGRPPRRRRRKAERMPITVQVTWNLIRGQLVCFYEATSQVVDHRIVDEYIRSHIGVARVCNAANFGHCLSAVAAAAEQGGSPS